jgi:hypothetical protein
LKKKTFVLLLNEYFLLLLLLLMMMMMMMILLSTHSGNVWIHPRKKLDYEVPGMTLLTECLYRYSPLRGITFEIPPLSSYALSPTMLPKLETFLELLLWNSFQGRHIFWMSSIS